MPAREGPPVAISSLDQLGVDPAVFARAVLERVTAEQASIHVARAMVRAKGEWPKGGTR